MSHRYQTVAAGESFVALGRFRSGRTVSIIFYNAATGAVIPSTGAPTEIGTTGVYRAPSSLIDTDPTAFTIIIWQMTDDQSLRTDEDVIVVGGFPDDIDQAISDNATPAEVLAQVTAGLTAQGLTVGRAANLDNLDAAVTTRASQASLDALNNLDSAAVQAAAVAALTAQGYTAARAPNLDLLDVAISTRASQSSLDALNDIDSAAVQAAVVAGLTAQGYTVARAPNLDNLDAAVTTRASQASLDGLENLSSADAQSAAAAALTAQGYTGARAANLDNLDAAVSTRASQATLDALNDLSSADAQAAVVAALTAQGYTVARAPGLDNLDAAVTTRASQASLDALENLSSADAQAAAVAALTAQGYTVARAGNLDDLDASIASRATQASLDALNDLSSADVQAAAVLALTAQGYTVARAANLDDLDASVASRSSHTPADVDAQLSGTHGGGSWLTGAGGTAPTASENADELLDRALSGHTTAGTVGAKLGDLELGILTAIGGLENLSQAEAQAASSAAVIALGYTAARAPNLDNLDAAVTTRSSHSAGDVWDETTAAHVAAGSFGAQVGALETGILAAISGLNDLDQAGVQTALTAQGYTSARAAFLDNLDATISAVIAAIGALENVSITDVETATQTGLTAQGYTAARAAELDSLATMLASIEKVRKWSTNRVEVNIAETQFDVYEDDGTTIAFSFTISANDRTRTPI